MNFTRAQLIKWASVLALVIVASVFSYCSGKSASNISNDELKNKVLQHQIDSLARHADSLTQENVLLKKQRAAILVKGDPASSDLTNKIDSLLNGKRPKVTCITSTGDTTVVNEEMVPLSKVIPIIQDAKKVKEAYEALKLTDSAIISDDEDIIATKDGIITDKDKQLKNKDDVIKNLKRKNLFQKLVVGTVTVGAAVLLIVK